MNRNTLLPRLSLLLLFLLGTVLPGLAQNVITPTAVITTSQWVGPTPGVKERMIDGSGLSGGGSVLTQTHDELVTAETMWHAGPDEGGMGPGATGTPPFGAPTVNTQAVEFDLGANYDLTAAHVWNMNQVGSIGRGVKDVQISFSSATTGAFSTPTSTQFTQGTGAAGLAAQVVPLTGATNVRRVRFAIQSAWSEAANEYVGLSEVRFQGTAVPNAAPSFALPTGPAGATWTARDSARNWWSITSSADGSKLAAVVYGGHIYTSTDSGVTWTAREQSRFWYSITSSADGSKLAAVVGNGQIYTSTDSGVTWTAREQSRFWYSITSSADGSMLAAVVIGGQIYTSTDSGVTWTARLTDANRQWWSITSSADGSKLAAVVQGGQIYTSTDSGVTWTAQASSRAWYSITSSADGSRLAAVVLNGQIYTSTDSGVTWTARESNRQWYTITSSADGSKLAAGFFGGHIYTSTDSGVTWTARLTDANRQWRSITSSADGSKLAAVANGGQIYTSVGASAGVSVAAGSGAYAQPFATSISPGPAAESGQTVSFIVTGNTNPGLFSTPPALSSTGTLTFSPANTAGTATISVQLADDGGTANGGVNTSPVQTFTIKVIPVLSGIAITPTAVTTTSQWVGPTAGVRGRMIDGSGLSGGGSVLTQTHDALASAVSMWHAGPNAGGISGGTTGSPPAVNTQAVEFDLGANYDLSGAHIWNFNGTGVSGRGVKDVQILVSSDTTSAFTPLTTTQFERGTDFSGMAAQVLPLTGATNVRRVRFAIQSAWSGATNEYVGLSEVRFQGTAVPNTAPSFTLPVGPAGATWTARLADANRDWVSITSSTDGGKLAVVVNNGHIYTSTDSGVTWTEREQSREWYSITSSADGSKLAAGVNNGHIYTSTDSGETWTPRLTDANRFWLSITSSANGSKLAAVDSGGQIYTSTDSGETWTPRLTDANRFWQSITSSADDGSKLAAVVNGGQIYTSTDSGVTWEARDQNRNWYSITSSTDGSKLAAGAYGGHIYTSTDSGVTWTEREQSRQWLSITSSADGSKLAAGVYSGHIYTSTDSGVTWTARLTDANRLWYSITSSADGSKLAAGAFVGYIYTSVGAGAGVSVAAGSGAYAQPFATSISPGPAADSGQTVSFTITGNTNPALFSTQPALSPTGTLTFTPASPLTTVGTATISVQLVDNGGTANGGVNTSPIQTFTIKVIPVLAGTAITPTAVTTTSQWVGPTAGVRERMIDGSGLSGSGSVLTQTHDELVTAETMWHAGPDSGGISGGVVGASPFGAPPVNTQAIEFDLGANYDLTGAHIWNFNGTGVSGRGVKDVEILVSSDTTSAFTALTTTQFERGTELPGLAAQIIPFTGATNVRRVRFAIQSAWSGATDEYVGLSEVRFQGRVHVPGVDSRLGDTLNYDLSWVTLASGESLKVIGLPPGLTFTPGPPPKITGRVLGPAPAGGTFIQVMNGKTLVRTVPIKLTAESYLAASTYELLLEEAGQPTGKLRVTVSNPTTKAPNPAFSGTLDRAGAVQRKAAGTFTAGALPQTVRVTFPAVTTTPAVSFDLVISSGSDLVTAATFPTSGLTGRGFRLARASRIPVGSPALTLTLPPAVDGDRTSTPAGIGFARGSVTTKALVPLTGQLGDAQAFTSSLSLSQTNQAVVWITPYTNKASYIGGIIDIADTGAAQRAASKDAAVTGLQWRKLADAKSTSYPTGFGPLTLGAQSSRWVPATTADGTAESLGLDFRAIETQYIAPAAGILPTRLSLRDSFALIRLAPENSVPFSGKIAPKTGDFSGSLTLAAPATKSDFSGVLLQEDSFGNLVGQGLIKIPVTSTVAGSFQTVGIRFFQPSSLGTHRLRIGSVANISLSSITLASGETLKVLGLPTGLALTGNAITGTVTGLGSATGVQIQVFNGTTVVRTLMLDLAVEPYAIAGRYEVLLENAGLPVGKLQVTVTSPTAKEARAAFSAVLDRVGETTRRTTGFFTASAASPLAVTVAFPIVKTLPAVSYELSISGTSNAITGSTSPASAVTARGFRLARAGHLPVGVPALTMTFPPTVAGDRTSTPGGIGNARGTITTAGVVSLSGMLGDGQAFTASLNLAQTNQAVVWVTPYTNKASYLGGFVSIVAPATPDRVLAPTAPPSSLKWTRVADSKALSYPSGFSALDLSALSSRWLPTTTATALAESLGLSFRGIYLSYTAPTADVLPLYFSLRDNSSLLRISPSNAVPFTKGKAVGKDGSFSGTLKLAAPALVAPMSGIFLQDPATGYTIGQGLIRVPITAPVKGSFQTIGVELQN